MSYVCHVLTVPWGSPPRGHRCGAGTGVSVPPPPAPRGHRHRAGGAGADPGAVPTARMPARGGAAGSGLQNRFVRSRGGARGWVPAELRFLLPFGSTHPVSITPGPWLWWHRISPWSPRLLPWDGAEGMGIPWAPPRGLAGAGSRRRRLSHGVSGRRRNTTGGGGGYGGPWVLSHGGAPGAGPGVVRAPLPPSPPDNAMDGGAQQSSLREPPGPGSAEQEERDGGEGPPELKRSQPLFIHGSSRQPLEEEPRASSLPSIPNPFPELCSPSNSPILSSTGLGQGPPRDAASHVVKVFGEDGACRSLEAAAGTTARQLCETLVRRTRALQDQSWALVELHQHLGLERCLEDHELVVEVQSSWPAGADARFVFRKNFAKYELFKSPAQSLFPEVMVSSCLEANKSMAHSELIQNFLNSGSCPEVQGFLQLREPGRKVWKRFHFSLRRSGLYYSTKGTSKDPRHLQYFADLSESNIYYVTQGKKHYGTPTEFGFCIKPYKVRSGVKGLKLLCSEDEQSRSCWMAAFRLFKYGMQLYRNYQQAQARLSQPHWIGPTPLRSVSDNALVAMDFSGCTGRVIENPSEVLSVALEEAQAWRKKTTHRYSLPAACHSSPLSAVIHRTQPWFHGRISREDTQQLISRQGLVDGVFLVRESQRNPKGFVLSLCHLQRVKHYLILPSEEEGRLYFTMDDGQTRFADLIQLVEFHQINRGILPCKLRHYCTCVAL